MEAVTRIGYSVGMKRKTRKRYELYEAMRDAIVYMRAHASESASIDGAASAAGMSVSHFGHAFTEWAGISPKRFLAHLASERAKSALAHSSVMKAAYVSGLSGPGRLHDLLVAHEAVSPGEFKRGDMRIAYGVHPSPFGACAIGITKRGVCYLSFLASADTHEARRSIVHAWPHAKLVNDPSAAAAMIKKIFDRKKAKHPLRLEVRGTNFQIRVWKALLAIPEGRVSSYTEIAQAAGFPKAVRAVGTACGKNMIAYLIPCHRVLTSSGAIGGYRWGIERKEAMLVRETIRKDKE